MTAYHIFHDAYMCFQCRWREVDTKEPPGAETSGAVGLHGSFQNKQRSPGGYQLTWTVRSPISSAPLPPCLFPLPSVLSAFSSDYTSHVLQPPAALRRLLWQQSPVKAWTGPVLSSPTHINIHIATCMCVPPPRWTCCGMNSHSQTQYAHLDLQLIDLLSQLLKEDGLGHSKHSVTNAELNSFAIYKAAKLRDVDFINGGGDTSCIIERSPSHAHLTRTRRGMHNVEAQMNGV